MNLTSIEKKKAQNKNITKGHILHDSTFMRYPGKSCSERRQVTWWVPGVGCREKRMGSVYRVRFQFGEIRKSWRWKVAMFAQLNVLGTAHFTSGYNGTILCYVDFPNQTSHMLTVHRRRRHNRWSCVVRPELCSAYTSLRSEMTSSQFFQASNFE